MNAHVGHREHGDGARQSEATLGCWFAIDVLACPECGGRLRLLATIDDPPVIEKILHHLGLLGEAPAPAPARTPAWLPSALPIFDGVEEPASLWSH